MDRLVEDGGIWNAASAERSDLDNEPNDAGVIKVCGVSFSLFMVCMPEK